jgi:hypothetical protein
MTASTSAPVPPQSTAAAITAATTSTSHAIGATSRRQCGRRCRTTSSSEVRMLSGKPTAVRLAPCGTASLREAVPMT